jgi:hypothetical protein
LTVATNLSVPEEGRAVSRLTLGILGVYLGIIVILMIVRQVKPTPDLFVLFASAVAIALGRGRAFVRDWIPFLVIVIAWEAMRGIADDFGSEVHSDSIIAIERGLFGMIPTVELKEALYTPGSPSLLDLAMSLVYLGYFLLPLLVAFGLWLADRRLYHRFVFALVLVSFAAFLTALVLPVAPPRFAGDYGQALPVHDIVRDTLLTLHIAPVTTWTYGNAIGNPVAAMPSLHAAFPLLAALAVSARWPRVGILLSVYAAVVWFAIVYLGHHYVIDALAGGAYALVVFALVSRIRLSALRWPHVPHRVPAPVRLSSRRIDRT